MWVLAAVADLGAVFGLPALAARLSCEAAEFSRPSPMILGVIILAPLYGWDLAHDRTFALGGATVATILYLALFPSILAR